MSENNEQAIAKYENFQLPAEVDSSAFSSDELAEDMEGLGFSFPRVKIPGGGSVHFELPGTDPESPEASKTLDGIILYSHPANALWPEDDGDDENTQPLCSSNDGQTGIGLPGGACAACAQNQWVDGKRECRNTRMLYILRDGDFLPIQLRLPPTSIKQYKDFLTSFFTVRGRATCGSVVQMYLKKMENGKELYSIAQFKKLYDFEGEKLLQVKNYAKSFKGQIKSILAERNAEAAGAPSVYDGYTPEAINGAYPQQEPGVQLAGDLPWGPPAGDVPEDLPWGPPAGDVPEDLSFGPPAEAVAGDIAFAAVASAPSVGTIDGDVEPLPA